MLCGENYTISGREGTREKQDRFTEQSVFLIRFAGFSVFLILESFKANSH